MLIELASHSTPVLILLLVVIAFSLGIKLLSQIQSPNKKID